MSKRLLVILAMIILMPIQVSAHDNPAHRSSDSEKASRISSVATPVASCRACSTDYTASLVERMSMDERMELYSQVSEIEEALDEFKRVVRHIDAERVLRAGRQYQRSQER